MPITYLRNLTGRVRSPQANRQLAGYLSFVAGATNAGGFLAVQQYTSHMTGIVSAMADHLVLGQVGLILEGLGALLSFLAGAATSAILINWARREHLNSEYALPLMLEAILLLCFGLLGGNLGNHQWLFVPATVMVLCFIMGLQNAMITKISHAEIRTTHITGMVTDIGIELGKLFYWNLARSNEAGPLVLAFVPVVDDVRDHGARLAAYGRKWAREVLRDVHALWLAARDPRTPWYAKAVALLVAGYALSPIDLIPDFIPVLGYLDDVVLVPLGVMLAIRMIPPDLMREYRAAAVAAGQRPSSRVAAAVIIVLWIGGAVVMAALLARHIPWLASN